MEPISVDKIMSAFKERLDTGELIISISLAKYRPESQDMSSCMSLSLKADMILSTEIGSISLIP
jgi:hypothetical protein